MNSERKGHLITQAKRQDAGQYKCRAENGIEPAIETEFEVQVSGTDFWQFTWPKCVPCSTLDLPAFGSSSPCQSKRGAFWLFFGFRSSLSVLGMRPSIIVEMIFRLLLSLSIASSVLSCE